MFCSAVELESEATAAAAAVEPVDEVQANITQLFTSIGEIAAEAPLIVYIKVSIIAHVARHSYLLREVTALHRTVMYVIERCLNSVLNGWHAW